MKKIFLSVVVVLSSAILLSSCLGSNDEELTYYDDAAMTAVTLGTLNRYLHTKTFDGQDSIAKSTVKGETYKFTIDQIKHEAYNTDSLPYGTDVTKVVCNIAAKNGGSVVIKSMTSDSVKYHSATDSVDFSQPRTFFIYSNSGRNYQEYTVRVNAHKQQADQFEWKRTAVGGVFENMIDMRAFQLGNKMFVAGTNGQTTWMKYTDIDDGQSWHGTTPNINMPLPADAYRNIIVKGNKMTMLMAGALWTSADGNEWTETVKTDISRLIGTDGNLIFALSADNQLVSSADNGQTWAIDKLDDSATLLPTQDISIAALPMITNPDAHRVILVGNRSVSDYPQDATAVVWSRIVENGESIQTNDWMRYVLPANALYQAPRQRNFTVMPYADGLIALGGQPLGACTVAAFSELYYSRDNGITWKKDSRLSLPSAFVNVALVFCAAVDSNHFVWLFSGETGEIWRARLSQLGWSDEQKIFRTKRK